MGRGINGMLTEQGILRNESAFRNVSVFEHDGRTNLLFHMDGMDLDMGKLAMWRIATSVQYGGTWLSDYLTEQLGANMDEKPQQRKKPDCPLIGQDGIIYNLMGIASMASANRQRKCGIALRPAAVMARRFASLVSMSTSHPREMPKSKVVVLIWSKATDG